MLMSEQLGRQGVPVALVVLFDGTQPATVGENVARVMNITQRVAITAGPGFHGELETINESGDANVSHTTIDKSPRLAGGGHRQDQDGSRSRRAGGTGERANCDPPVERPDKPESRL